MGTDTDDKQKEGESTARALDLVDVQSAFERMPDRSGTSQGGIDAPFAADVWRRAKVLAERYQIVVSFEDGEYYGRGLELPFVMDDGKTTGACIAKTREALAVTVATMIGQGQTPPLPGVVPKITGRKGT